MKRLTAILLAMLLLTGAAPAQAPLPVVFCMDGQCLIPEPMLDRLMQQVGKNCA